MSKKYKYFDRELSWLSFNYRVLEEMKEKTMPLYERIKFCAIYASNLDEFYKVRVASTRHLLQLKKNTIKNLQYNPQEILEQINREVSKQEEEYYDIVNNSIIPELEENNIILYKNQPLQDIHIDFARKYFYAEVLPHIQPVIIEKDAVITFLQDNVIYLTIKLHRKKNKASAKVKNRKNFFAIIKLPTQYIGRFVELPALEGKFLIMFLDDILRINLDKIFPGYDIVSSHIIKLARDADMQVEDEFSGNLFEKVKKSLSKRKTGEPCRFIFDKEMPNDLLVLLKDVFKLSKKDFFPAPKYHGLSDFFQFPNPIGSSLEYGKMPALDHPCFEKYDSLLEAVKENDIMLHFPYHSYDYVLRFLNEAALDPKVEEIKVTQYRVAPNSAVVGALTTAALNGKKVTVFVEVKARFDEEANIKFADIMRKAGINVISSLPGLKVHAKTALIIRQSNTKPSKKRGFAFVSTGNFNEKTAQIYADHGLFTSNDAIIEELKLLFEYFENQNPKLKFNHLLVPNFNLLPTLAKKIQREKTNVAKGKKGYILLKMNGLEEEFMINQLYEASMAGVEIDLIVRGICRLVPNQKYSKNIRVTRIVDRYLEHARVFVFYNQGQYETYISSADLMNRNLHRRIESVVPVYNQQIKEEIIEILKIQLADNVKARLLNENMENVYIENNDETPVRAQYEIYNYLKDKEYTEIH